MLIDRIVRRRDFRITFYAFLASILGIVTTFRVDFDDKLSRGVLTVCCVLLCLQELADISRIITNTRQVIAMEKAAKSKNPKDLIKAIGKIPGIKITVDENKKEDKDPKEGGHKND